MTQPAPPALPGHDGGVWAPVPVEVVATWAPGHFAENLAVDPSGAVFVSQHLHHRVERFDPATRTVATFARFPTAVTGLAFDGDGVLWATGGEVGQAPGRIWRVQPDGTVEDWLEIADAVFLNGCTFLPGGATLLVCESATGRVLAVDARTPGVRDWVGDERLRPVNPGLPGANGVKVHDGAVWVSVTDLNTLYRIAVGSDGAPGPLEQAEHDLRADDFAVDTEGALHIATHPAHTVLRLDPDGTRTTVAGPDQGATGSTACAFGRAPGDETALYVTTTGGVGLPWIEKPEEAKLLRLEVGRRGVALPA
jgi:sugar lactone lactonase YvrE